MEEAVAEKKGISILGAFGMVALVILIQIVISIPLAIIDLVFIKLGFNGLSIYISFVGEILNYVLFIFFVIKRIRKKEEFCIKIKYKPNIKEYLYALLFLGAHLMVFSNTIGILIEKIEVSKWVAEAFDEIFINPVIAFASVCIIAPVFEETVYRGIILEQLSKRYSMITSIITSALLFGLIHFNIHQSTNAFFMGLILGFMYLKTDSLLLCMFWHFSNNFLVFISSMYVHVPEDISNTVPGVSIVELVFGIILLTASYLFFKNREEVSKLSAVDI